MNIYNIGHISGMPTIALVNGNCHHKHHPQYPQSPIPFVQAAAFSPVVKWPILPAAQGNVIWEERRCVKGAFFHICHTLHLLGFRKQTNTRASRCNCKRTEGRLDRLVGGGQRPYLFPPLLTKGDHWDVFDQDYCRNRWFWQNFLLTRGKKEVCVWLK